jgi:hypothetical protein
MVSHRLRHLHAVVVWSVVFVLAGCGGGGGASPGIPHLPGSATQAKTDATGTLTVKYPAGFYVVRGSSKSRNPAYVNPTVGDYLHVFVDNNEIGTSPIAVNPTPDGTQVLTVPFFSANSNVVFVTENDAPSGGNVLAQGTSGSNSVTVGGTPAVTLTLNMNATRVGLTTDPVAGSDAIVLSQSGNPSPLCLPDPNIGFPFAPFTANVFPFGADPSLGFVIPGTASGFGGIAIPTLTFQSSAGTSKITQQQLSLVAVVDGATDPITANFSVTSPATGGTSSGAALLYTPAGAPPNCANPGVVTLNALLVSPPPLNGGQLSEQTLPPANQFAFPVLAWHGFTYWPFSFQDNRSSIGIAKYDSQYNLVAAQEYVQDRYISSISINAGLQTVTFNLQGSSLTMAWSALP